MSSRDRIAEVAGVAILLGVMQMETIYPVAAAPAPAAPAAEPPMFVNDASYGGRGADLLPLHKTPVHLLSADIDLKIVPVQDAWQVTATYELANPTADKVTLKLAFPEELCRKDQDCAAHGGGFRDIVTTVRGQAVTPRTGEVADAGRWLETPGQVYQYDVAFAPKESLRIVHSYVFDRSHGNDWWALRYLTREGARWGAPVKSVRFTVRLDQPVWYAAHRRQFTLKRFAESLNPGGRGTFTELVLEARDLQPSADFWLIFPADSIALRTPEGFCAGCKGDQSAEEVSKLVAKYETPLLRACRNHVYALHGYPFKDAALRQRYYAEAPELPEWLDKKEFTLTPRPENRGFKESWLSPGEQAYIRALASEERKRKKR